MAIEKITAERRTEFGKGAARRIRRDDKVPAVVYGGGLDPIHLTLPGHETMLALKHGGANALLELHFDGESQLALTRDVQTSAILRIIEHIDFVAVKKGEKVTVDVPVVVVGEAEPETLVVTENATLYVEAEATHIPESIEVSVEGAEAGTQFLAGDVTLPKGTSLLSDAELLVINVTQAMSEEQLEAELESAEEEAGIEREESDEEAAAEGDEEAAEGDEEAEAEGGDGE